MYNVNRQRINELLDHMNDVLLTVKPVLNLSKEEILDDKKLILAVERALNIAIEAIVDVGNLIIDRFIMRDPGSYQDIIEILRDEQVLPEEQADKYKKVVAYRKILVHEYTDAQPEVTYQLTVDEYTTLLSFAYYIRLYLDKVKLHSDGV